MFSEADIWAADGPLTPVDVLEKLAVHSDVNVRVRVAGNPSTPGNLLALFDGYKSPELTVALVNPNYPIESLLILLEEEDGFYRKSIAMNPALPREILEELIRDSDAVVRQSAALNSSWSSERLESLAVTGDEWVRSGVVDNPNVALGTLLKLLSDEEPAISITVSRVLKKMDDEAFQAGLVEAELQHMVGLPREWVMKALNVKETIPFRFSDYKRNKRTT